LENRSIIAGNVDEEVVIIKRLELDLDIGCLHNFVDLAILFATDELAMLVGKLDLEANLVMKGLVGLGSSSALYVAQETDTPLRYPIP